MGGKHAVEDASSDSIFGGLPAEEFYEKHGVKHEEAWVENAQGMPMFTQRWDPIARSAKALVMVAHGYGADSSSLVQLTAITIAARGFSVHAVDHRGHGRSHGLRAFVPGIAPLVDDCAAFFDSVRRRHPALPAFLYGESLGGAICLLLHLRQPDAWRGAILNGAMCGISPRFKPPWLVEHALLLIARWLPPTWPVVPGNDIPSVSFKEPWKRELARRNPRRYAGKPRVGTALELLRVARELESRMAEVRLPFLAVHGELDMVCDPGGVQRLYERASSADKTLRIYGGMWHQLVGEPKENVDTVFGDIFSWLDERTS